MLNFSGKEFVKVVEEALAKQCTIQLYTDNGIYLAAVDGEFSENKNERLYTAYAEGCNPLTDENWQKYTSKELKYLKEPIIMHPRKEIVQHIFTNKLDFEITGSCILY